MSTEIRKSKGKVMVTVMSSNLHRVQQVVDAAISAGRQISFFGRSVEQNVRIGQELGFLKIPTQAIVKKKKINKVPKDKICLIVAGSQGQPGSALVRTAQGEHHDIEIMPGDKSRNW